MRNSSQDEWNFLEAFVASFCTLTSEKFIWRLHVFIEHVIMEFLIRPWPLAMAGWAYRQTADRPPPRLREKRAVLLWGYISVYVDLWLLNCDSHDIGHYTLGGCSHQFRVFTLPCYRMRIPYETQRLMNACNVTSRTTG